MGLFLFLLVVKMRMSRIGLAMVVAGLGSSIFVDGMSRATSSLNALSNIMRATQPSRYKSKPNRISQKKRRLYKRQGRK